MTITPEFESFLSCVFAKVYRGGRSMGSHQARNFSSLPPGINNASNVAARYLLRGITATVLLIIRRQEAAVLKRQEELNEISRKLEEFFENDEQFWSDMAVRGRSLRKTSSKETIVIFSS
ncbi:PREDICTED: uncharacterized protein LOC104781999 [Camelina sativa]|uniref:Uncharacterized protein LOC104781999 n=1 Tax=Camelina sativa TaxID=90675 RepID=A0ABM0YS92_CAMSA|nr:PREDICTED: uncharacterized protein LOC104781999 [Camelina sativa]